MVGVCGYVLVAVFSPCPHLRGMLISVSWLCSSLFRVLCSAVEDENSFDRHAVAVLKDGRVVDHVHVAIFCKT